MHVVGGAGRWGKLATKRQMALRSSYGKICSYLPPAWARDLKITPRAGRVEVQMQIQ